MNRFSGYILAAGILCFSHLVFGQGIGINTTGNAAAEGAILDVSAIDKAVLLPRTTTESILSPIEGMVIYDTTQHQFHYYNGIQWCALLEEGAYQFYWADEDGDGYGFPFNVIYSPDPPEFFVDNNDDCDDTNPDLNPLAEEICDGIDNDCDGLVDADDPDLSGIPVSWLDADGDGFGDAMEEVMECPVPEGYVTNNLDCDDGNPNINPSANEVCDGIDNNCNELIDFDDPGLVDGATYYEDADNDGFGNPDVFTMACDAPSGFVDNDGDCDDANSNNFPGAEELCDNMDNDCDGETDEDFNFNIDINNCGDCGIVCDDGFPCTTDACSAGVCTTSINDGFCLIDGQCYSEGEVNPESSCQICNTDISQTEWFFLPDGTNCEGGTCSDGQCLP